MTTLFESIKLLFFVATVLLSLLVMQGEVIFPSGTVTYLKSIMMPGYLVLCGLIIGYLIALIRAQPDMDDDTYRRMMIQSFLIGIICGIILAIFYIFAGS